jgi:hypothetical protein
MIVRTLKIYEPYLSSVGGAAEIEEVVELPVESLTVAADSLNVEVVPDSLELSAE